MPVINTNAISNMILGGQTVNDALSGNILPSLNSLREQHKMKSPMDKKKDKNRFIISKKTKKEFGLKDAEIPMNMRTELDDNTNYVNHVD